MILVLGRKLGFFTRVFFAQTSKQIVDSLLTRYNVVDYRLAFSLFCLFSF